MAYRVKIHPSGHELTVAEDETILKAALREGLALPYGCRNGACGTCKGRLLAGEVHYQGDLPPALSDQEDEQGLALFCQARPLGDLEVEVKEIGAAKDLVVKTLPVRVTEKTPLAHDVMGLKLKLPAAERLQFLAGQYVDVLLRDGARRGFSMANPPHEDAFLELHVRYVEGGRFTGWVFNEMREKALLRIQGPLGTFFLREDADRPVLLVAGGTGFAPMKAILEHAFRAGPGRPLHLYWGARARRDLYLHELAQGWAQTRAGFRYTPVLSEPAGGDAWDGATGWVHERVLADYPDLSGHDVYAAGPPEMIEAIKRDLAARGLPDDRLFYDSFEFAGDHRMAGAEG